MAHWTAFPYDAADYRFDAETLTRHWPRLHAGDAEPLPDDPRVLAAWALFHAGRFEQATEAGLALGRAGATVADRAQFVHAAYLEKSEPVRLALFLQVAERAEAQLRADPGNANAHFHMACGLGRSGQGISIGKALAQGLAGKVKTALETAIGLEPRHADAHIALGAFHAESIDKLGSLLGLAQAASKDAGLSMFKTALRLNPQSPIAMIEYANGLVMLEGDKMAAQATQLYQAAAACTPLDAKERLDVEMARAGLVD